MYKAFGQTFIYDDHFLSIVGAICSFFNCSGRLIYGFIMDKTSYKVAMSLEAVLLTLLGEYILLFQIPFFSLGNLGKIDCSNDLRTGCGVCSL